MPRARCNLCSEEKEFTLEFWTADNRMPSGLRSGRCRECVKAYKRAYGKTKDHRAHSLKWSWGMTREQYNDKLAEQGGGCASCGQPPKKKPLNVDHDHNCCPGNRSCGKCIRGLLCNWCNIAEGYLASPKIALVEEYRRRWNAEGSETVL